MKVPLDAEGNYAGGVEIYQLTAPNGKIYIGQANCYIRSGDKWLAHGFEGRWKAHKKAAQSQTQDYCKALCNSLRKYGPDSFKSEVLLRVPKSLANHYETKFILTLDTLVPNGLNLMARGDSNHISKETRQKMSASAKVRVYSVDCRAAVSRGVREVHRARAKGKGVPCGVSQIKWGVHTGYRVVVKYQGKRRGKAFMSRKLSMPEKLQLAVEARDKILKDLGLPAITDDPVIP